MKTELTLVDPKEFGLETKQTVSIEDAFKPKLVEAEAFTAQYETIITQELNADTFKAARELRLKLVKVRTGIADVHKSEKAFFLASGKFVDALKNKLTTPIEQMEERLMEIEKYEQKLEAERKAKLKAERLELLLPYEVDVTYVSIEDMTEEQFNGFLSTNKLAFETKKEQERLAELARIEAEQKAEEERLAKIEADRLERIRIEEENDKLKAEQERLAKEQEAKDKASKIEADRLAKIAEEEKAKADELAAQLKAKEDAENLAKEQERQRIEAEEADKLAKEKAALLAPDKEKVKVFFGQFTALEFPELQSEAGIAMSARVKEALAMVKQLIINDSKSLL